MTRYGRCALAAGVLAVVLVSSALPARSAVAPDAGALELARDYAMSGLTEEAKRILIPELHDPESELDPADVRMLIATTCRYLDADALCADYHWARILTDHPASLAARTVQRVRSVEIFFDVYGAAETIRSSWEDWTFRRELELSQLLWDYRPPEFALNLETTDHAVFVVDYLDVMKARYGESSSKRLEVLLNQFLLLAGYNDSNFGVKATFGSFADELEARCEAISEEMRQTEGGTPYYVWTQFLMGVENSRVKTERGFVKIKKRSRDYFENIMEVTQGDRGNPFRVFSYLWLRRFYDRKGIEPPAGFGDDFSVPWTP